MDTHTERLIRRLAKQRGQTKSDLIRTAIELLAREAAEMKSHAASPTAYDRLAHLIGVADSGGRALSERTSERLRDQLITRQRSRSLD